MCRINEETPYIIMNDLVCSKNNRKASERLIKIAEMKIKEMEDIMIIQMVSLNIKTTKLWYEKLGYSIIIPSHLKKIMIIQKTLKNAEIQFSEISI